MLYYGIHVTFYTRSGQCLLEWCEFISKDSVQTMVQLLESSRITIRLETVQFDLWKTLDTNEDYEFLWTNRGTRTVSYGSSFPLRRWMLEVDRSLEAERRADEFVDR